MHQRATKSKTTAPGTCSPTSGRSLFPAWLQAGLLGLLTLALYWPVMRCDFVNYDDNVYVTHNPHVSSGLSLQNIKWSFCHPVASNWHPLTMLSHMLDCQLFGLKPLGHHLMSVLLHAVNDVLIFLLLRRLTGADWRSLWVAALFAVHPLHVESVAWVAERKDVLSGCLGLLSLIFYARFAGQQAPVENLKSKARIVPTPGSRINYGLAWSCLALGLMSKAMLVTWPFVMLLLDYWPLKRFQPGCFWRLAREKIPFLALAAVASVVTFLVQQHEGAMTAAENIPFGARCANALISCCRYLAKLLWPTDLSVLYPHPGHWPLPQILLAGVILAGISGLLWWQRERYPFLLMGWLWYGGTLVPVLGLVQVGEQAMADRYAYLPSIGIFIMVVWGASELVQHWRQLMIPFWTAGAAGMICYVGLTRQQLGYWRDSETLFRHALAVTQNNFLAHNNLGLALGMKGQTGQAIIQFQEALRLRPNVFMVHYNLGSALAVIGHSDEAIIQLREAILLEPYNDKAHYDLGYALAMEGRTDEAMLQFQEAVQLKPDFAEAHYNLARALVMKNRMDESFREYQEAIRLKPDYAEAHYDLGCTLAIKGRTDEAIGQYQAALRLKPDDAGIHNDLGNALDREGKSDEAIREYQEAIRIRPDFAEAHGNLGAALGNKGRTDEAIVELQEALRLKPDDAQAHYNLANALGGQGRIDDEIRQYQEALRIKPDFAEARTNLEQALKMGKP